MINYSQLLGDGFSEFDSAFNSIQNTLNGVGKTIDKAIEKVNIPMNIYKNDDGSQVIEIAAVGLKKEDIKMNKT